MMGTIQTGFDFLFAAAMQAPQIRPEAASSIAEGVDHLYFALTFITLFFTFVIFSTILYFMVKYRRRAEKMCIRDSGGAIQLGGCWRPAPERAWL